MMNIRKSRRKYHSTSIHVVHLPRAHTANKITPVLSNSQKQTHNTDSEIPLTIDSTVYPATVSDPSIDSLIAINPLIHNDSFNSQLASTTNINHPLSIPTEKTDNHNCWPFPRKKIFICVIILILLVSIVITIPIAVIFSVFQSNHPMSSFANITPSYCVSSSCMYSMLHYSGTNVRSYSFDGNTYDDSLTASGIGMASNGLTPSFTSTGYVGSAIILTWANGNYVKIPYVNISYQSFTLEVWITPLTPTGGVQDDYGIFQQCDANQICFILTLRFGHIQLSFNAFGSNTLLISLELIPYNIWTHVTIVYDAVLFQQLIYINGVLDTMSIGMVQPYQGSSISSNTTIGLTKSLAYNLSYFSGYIDNFVITTGVAKTACQILNDATLISYFPFDNTNTMLDQSNNNAGTSSGTDIVTGRIQQGLLFSSATNSYFQSQCFSSLRHGNPILTFALWINPVSVTGGTIIHTSQTQNSSSPFCADLLSLTANGSLVIQIMQSLTAVVAIQGPNLEADTWTHLIVMISSPNGIRLIVNGTVATTYPASVNTLSFYSPTNVQMYITLGNSQPTGFPTAICVTGSLTGVPGAFSGIIDDFRMYSRELTEDEICNLANP